MAIDLTYPTILRNFEHILRRGRTESRAFLQWFLQHYYRLEDVQAEDAICDGSDDKGVDGIFIDDNFERIDVFQARLNQNNAKTLGDTQLKEFSGTLIQFNNAETLETLANTTANKELRRLILEDGVLRALKSGYTVRGVFITNARRDANAIAYLEVHSQLTLYDADALAKLYIPPEATPPIASPAIFDVSGFDCAEYNVGTVKMLLAPLRAVDLIQLEGLSNQQLFSWNVRGGLGQTKVNKDIAKSIGTPTEHPNFLLFHNGLTILCEALNRHDDQIEIQGYVVVNGCQSLTTLYQNRTRLTTELRLLARLIQLPPSDDLATKITHHSNNQNAITARDLQSNSEIQRRLQNEFSAKFSGTVFYQIKRGEIAPDGARVIDNADAGRILLAFDLREPWSCHQTYKVFDELYAKIFARPEVNAFRILAFQTVCDVVVDCCQSIENKLLAEYGLTRYFLLFLLREALEGDEMGKEFCKNPEALFKEPDGERRLTQAIKRVASDLIVDLNAEVKERKERGAMFDFKSDFKSPNAVRDLAKAIVPMFQKAVSRGRATSFEEEWRKAAEPE